MHQCVLVVYQFLVQFFFLICLPIILGYYIVIVSALFFITALSWTTTDLTNWVTWDYWNFHWKPFYFIRQYTTYCSYYLWNLCQHKQLNLLSTYNSKNSKHVLRSPLRIRLCCSLPRILLWETQNAVFIYLGSFQNEILSFYANALF